MRVPIKGITIRRPEDRTEFKQGEVFAAIGKFASRGFQQARYQLRRVLQVGINDDGPAPADVVETGTHDALIAQGGRYAQLWQRQQADRDVA